jgi:hypothetical protein
MADIARAIAKWLLGDAAIRRLQECDRLKTQAETHLYRAQVFAWGSVQAEQPPHCAESVYHFAALHDECAAKFNALRYWWMRRIEPMRKAQP